MILNTLTDRATELADWARELNPLAFWLADFDLKKGSNDRTPSWFNLKTLQVCLERIEIFTENINKKNFFRPRPIPAFFLQLGDAAEDEADLIRLQEVDQTPDKFLPCERYLHTNICWSMELATAQNGWRIKPRSHYNGLRDYRVPGKALGYRLVEGLPQALGVSDQTMTENMVRMIGHDLMHCLLPDIDLKIEPYHDLLSLYVMMQTSRRAYESDWDLIVSREATDPLFCCYGSTMMEKLVAGELTVLGRKVLRQLQAWHPPDGGQYRKLFPLIYGPSADLALTRLSNWVTAQARYGFPAYVGEA